MPGGFENRSVTEFRSGGEEESIGAEEGGIGVVEVRGKTEPGIGDGIEGERLVILAISVVNSEEEEPGAGKGRGGEGWSGN